MRANNTERSQLRLGPGFAWVPAPERGRVVPPGVPTDRERGDTGGGFDLDVATVDTRAVQSTTGGAWVLIDARSG